MAARCAGSLLGGFGRSWLPCSLGRAQWDKGLAQAQLTALGKNLPVVLVQQAPSTAPVAQGTVRKGKRQRCPGEKARALPLPRANPSLFLHKPFIAP